ncbi:integral membrane protein [Plectosphaerella plurivora]|uniref:Integral membrane protein n=1 Tax=Plectosphaerella plurivora TaxID=936078 RepID=A0A9P8VFV8_9PEZI|nr:integral membrane protein [Plectosphaerella plurivora]
MASTGGMPDIKSRGMELFFVQLIFLILSGICVVIRAYVRVFMVKKVTLDDYLIFLAMAIYFVYGCVALHGVLHGATGKRIEELSLDAAALSLRAWYICEVLYSPATLAIRASVCVVLLRLSSQRLHIWIIWINFVLIAIVSTVFFFILTFQCSPVSYFWMQVYGLKGSCIPVSVVPTAFWVHSIISSLSDWCLGLLPVAILWKVKINLRTKAIIAFLLSIGIIAGVAPIVRLQYVAEMEISIEFLYVTIDVGMWSIMEPALGIIAACLATYRPLFKNWGFGWTANKRSRSPSSKDISKGTGSSGSTSGKRSSFLPWRNSAVKELNINANAANRASARVEPGTTSPDGSEMELNKRETDRSEEVQTPRSWDIERGGPVDLSLGGQRASMTPEPLVLSRPSNSNITVRTSVNVTSKTADPESRPASRSTEGDSSGALQHPDMPPPPPVSRGRLA